MRMQKRRRNERKTDYKSRLALLKSSEIRLVARKTNRYIIAQIVKTEIAQDKVLFGISSKFLLKNSWPKEMSGSLKSMPAAYLTGFAIGKLAKKNNINKAIFDIGMYRNVHKSRLHALLKGAIDADLEINHGKETIPSEEQIRKDKKTAQLIEKLKEKI